MTDTPQGAWMREYERRAKPSDLTSRLRAEIDGSAEGTAAPARGES